MTTILTDLLYTVKEPSKSTKQAAAQLDTAPIRIPSLPNEIILEIMRYLSLSDLMTIKQVSHL